MDSASASPIYLARAEIGPLFYFSGQKPSSETASSPEVMDIFHAARRPKFDSAV